MTDGQQVDGYKGYPTNYRDLDIDIYKLELWRLLRDVLTLLHCDTQKLQDQIFPTIIEDGGGVTSSGAIYTSRANKRINIDNKDKKANNIQNESLNTGILCCKGRPTGISVDVLMGRKSLFRLPLLVILVASLPFVPTP